MKMNRAAVASGKTFRRVFVNKWIPTFLVLITSMPTALAANPATFKSTQATHDVALETDPHSAFWRGALPIYAEVDKYGRSLPRYRTEVLSRWTKDNLYFLFVCPYEELYLKPSPDVMAKTNLLWNWDVAEVFIGSNFQNIRHYKEFELSPQGEWLDLSINLDHPHHEDGWTWKSGFATAARIDRNARIWYGAMRIPFSAIDRRTPAPGNDFRINLFRSQGPPADRKQVAWQAPMSDSFHVPEHFGLLELVKRR